VDLSAWSHWRVPAVVKEIGDDLLQGRVMVTIDYIVPRAWEAEFS